MSKLLSRCRKEVWWKTHCRWQTEVLYQVLSKHFKPRVSFSWIICHWRFSFSWVATLQAVFFFVSHAFEKYLSAGSFLVKSELMFSQNFSFFFISFCKLVCEFYGLFVTKKLHFGKWNHFCKIYQSKNPSGLT